MIGTDTAKSRIYERLAIEDSTIDGYVHLSQPFTRNAFFNQLTAEKQDTIYNKGFPRTVWVLPSGRRNEVLDCAVLAKAAAYKIGLHRWRPAQWLQLEQKVQPPTPDLFDAASEAERAAQVEAATPVAKAPARKNRRPQRARQGFVSGVMHG